MSEPRAPRVLIVDDEEELVSALVERLNLRGFHARGVTTGAGSAAIRWSGIRATSSCST